MLKEAPGAGFPAVVSCCPNVASSSSSWCEDATTIAPLSVLFGRHLEHKGNREESASAKSPMSGWVNCPLSLGTYAYRFMDGLPLFAELPRRNWRIEEAFAKLKALC